MRRLTTLICLVLPLTATAESSLPFMKHLLGDKEFYEPWGIGFDFFTMEQQYSIKQLQFDLPGVSIPDPSQLDVQNDVKNYDLKVDVWLTPFLNVFAVLGYVDAETIVDLSSVPVTGLPFPLGKLPVQYDGSVYGAGLTLAYGGERWFTSLTSVWTDTNLSGDFDSSVNSFIAQPRIGMLMDSWAFWVGGMYLDTEESHAGSIVLPILGPVPFSVELEGSDKWNTAVGLSYTFGPESHLSFEAGFGDRDHTLFNYTYRF